MNAFLVVIIIVAVFGIALGLTPRFGTFRLLSRVGRRGGSWIDHSEDQPIEDRPGEDERDAPIPVRPLRGRGD
jgi:hypothetical protein